MEGISALRATHKAGLLQGRWPRKWATSQVLYLKKPGKEPGPAENYREIQLMDTAAKICTGAYAGKEAQHLLQYLKPEEYGFAPKRGTNLAVPHLQIVTSRLRQLGKQYVIFLGDIKAAFPSTTHEGLFLAVRQFARERGVAVGVELRYHEVIYVLEMGGRRITVKAHRGVVTGESLGPLAFLLFYHAYLIQMQDHWDAEVGEESPLTVTWDDHTWGDPILVQTERTLDLTHVIYADDHAAVMVFQDWNMIKNFLGVMHGMQQVYGLTGHLGKSYLLWHFSGKGKNSEKKE